MSYVEAIYGRQIGAGALATPPAPIGSYTKVQPAADGSFTCKSGLRYRIGIVFTFDSDPTDNYRLQQEALNFVQQQGWQIEFFGQIQPAVQAVSQWVAGFMLQGIAPQDIALKDDSFAQYGPIGVQASSPSPAPPGQGVPAGSGSADTRNWSFAWGAVAAVAVGVAGYGVYRAIHHYVNPRLAVA